MLAWFSMNSGALGQILGNGLAIWIFSFLLDWAILRRFISSHQIAALVSVPIMTVIMVALQAASINPLGVNAVIAVGVFGVLVLAIRWFTVDKLTEYEDNY